MLKRFLSFFFLFAVNCTCVASNTLAYALEIPPPCHHVETPDDNQKQNNKHCCQEKNKAWKEALEEKHEDLDHSFLPVSSVSFYLPQTFYHPKTFWFTPPSISISHHISRWNTIRLII